MARWNLLVSAALIVALLLPVLASAHFLRHWDPDDAPGRDLRHVEVFLSDHARRIHGDVALWSSGDMYSSYAFEFDSRGDGGMDYYVVLPYDGGSGGLLGGSLIRADGTDTGAVVHRTCDEWTCWFPFSFPAWRLHATKHVRWRVQVSGLDYGQRPGHDVAPNTGWYQH